jgi:signal transduction histidine kinase
MNILIADDDPVSRRLLQSHLAASGYAITAAEDGAAAWRLFEAGDFSMVLTDWMMPGMDGPELVRRIRGSGRPHYVYIILLTARSEKEDVVAGIDAGADEFLTKPVHREELRARLRAGERILRLERDLHQTQAALFQTEKLASLGRLAAGMAHEINNPLAFVTNNLAVLRRDVLAAMRLLDLYHSGRGTLAAAAPELAAEIARLEEELDLDYVRGNLGRLFEKSLVGLQRVRNIVLNLRTFARLDEAERKNTDLNEAVAATAEVLRHEIDRKGIRLETHLQPLPPLLCHPGKVNQVLLNVLLNAVQACAPGGRVAVRTRAEAGDVVVEVEDDGLGIKPEHLPRVFEPFFTTKPLGQGMGLGLSVSYGIVRDHGGTITAESTPGRGSVFRIRLPPAVGPGRS